MDNEEEREAQLGGQMSFLEHLDEFRRRLINSALIVTAAFCICFYFSGRIYNFLAIPVMEAMGDAQRIEVPIVGEKGDEKVVPLSTLKVGDKGRYVFDKAAKLGVAEVSPGTSVSSVVVDVNGDGNFALYTDEPLFAGDLVVPAGVKLPANLFDPNPKRITPEEMLVVNTAIEPFTLYVTVSLYAAIALSMPLLLLQIWGFIAPALYRHERSYVTPFVLLSTTSFVGGAAFAYYVLFPPAIRYLLGIGSDFRLMLKATDYFDFITLIMLAMGIIFQMPAVSYVLARIGLISAGFLIRSWKVALVAILILAAVVSPTGDAFNMSLFAMPMIGLYIISIFVAWAFGKKREPDEI